ncbi:hypothetical protein [Nonomuraea sp. NPDC023979]|uniref:hypothetical protein n=1 Tax=Nonomuraea sp. NPDC023979 TaxID=3154796 RepID=UPI0033F87455
MSRRGTPADPAHDSGALEVAATRREGRWTTQAGTHGVVVHAPTLKALQASAQQALALTTDTPAVPPIRIHPRSAELHALAKARQRYDTALRQAVQSLRADGATWSDIASACHVRIADAQNVLGTPP